METPELKTPPASLLSELQGAEASLDGLAANYHEAVGRRDALAGLLRQAMIEVPLPAGVEAPAAAVASVESPQTVSALCREGNLVQKKLAYDLAALPEDDNSEEVARLCDAARARENEIEDELAQRDRMTVGEIADVLRLTRRRLDNEFLMDDETIEALVHAAITSLNRIEGFPNAKKAA